MNLKGSLVHKLSVAYEEGNSEKRQIDFLIKIHTFQSKNILMQLMHYASTIADYLSKYDNL